MRRAASVAVSALALSVFVAATLFTSCAAVAPGVLGGVLMDGGVTVLAGAPESCMASAWFACLVAAAAGGAAFERRPSVGAGGSRKGAWRVLAGGEVAVGSARFGGGSSSAGVCMCCVAVLAGAGASALSRAAGVRVAGVDKGLQGGEMSSCADPDGGRAADRGGPPKRPRVLDRRVEGPRRLEGWLPIAWVLCVMRAVAVVATW